MKKVLYMLCIIFALLAVRFTNEPVEIVTAIFFVCLSILSLFGAVTIDSIKDNYKG